MPVLKTMLASHEQLRTIVCCLCGAAWDEQYVSVVLLSDQERMGELCPRCLSRTPQDLAAQLEATAARLNALYRELLDTGPPTDVILPAPGAEGQFARLREETARLLAESSHVCATSVTLWARTRTARQASAGLPPTPAAQAPLVAAHAEAVRALAEQLANLAGWPTSIQQTMDREQLAIMKQLSVTAPGDLRRLVADRYREFLVPTS